MRMYLIIKCELCSNKSIFMHISFISCRIIQVMVVVYFQLQ